MKKSLFTGLCLLWGAAWMSATTFTVDGIAYNVLSGTNVEVTSGPDYSGSVTVPATVVSDGTTYTVTRIGKAAFRNKTGLTELVMPNTVTSIGQYAVLDAGLTKLTLSNTLTTLDAGALGRPGPVEVIDLPKSLTTVGTTALMDLKVEELVFPEALTDLPANTCLRCQNLKKIVFEGPTPLHKWSFQSCTAIERIEYKMATPPTVEGEPFSDQVLAKAVLVVPDGALETYKAHEYFSQFANITDVSHEDQFKPFDPTEMLPEGAKSFQYYDNPTHLSWNAPNWSHDWYGRESERYTMEHSMGLTTEQADDLIYGNPFTVAMRMQPAFTPELVGKDIIAIHVHHQRVKSIDPNFKLFVAPQLAESNEFPSVANAYEVVDAVKKGSDVWGILSKPVRITSDKIFAGYQICFTARDINAGKCVYTSGSGNQDGGRGTFLGTAYGLDPENKDSWETFSWSNWGAAPIEIWYVDGKNEPNQADVKGFVGDKEYFSNTPLSIPVKIANMGDNELTNIEYTYSIDGGAAKTGTCAFAPVPSMESIVASLTMDAVALGNHSVAVTVTKANGVDNPSNFKDMTFSFNAIAPAKPMPQPVYEATYWDRRGTNSTNLGTNHYDVAVNYYNPELKDMKIVGAKLHAVPEGVGNIYFWMGRSTDEAANAVKTKATVKDGEAIVVFPEPMDLEDANNYVGYGFDKTYECTASARPLVYGQGPLGNLDAMWIIYTTGQWTQISDGVAPVTLLLSGNLPEASLKGEKFVGISVAAPGEPFTLDLSVSNFGAKPVQTVDYEYTAMGQTRTGQVDLITPVHQVIGIPQTITLDFGGINTSNTSETMSVKLTKANGTNNAYVQDPLQTTVNMASFRPVKRPFMEEGTGTNCGWCPRGMIAMDVLQKKYPDFIGAAYHRYNSSDPMYIGDIDLPWKSGYGFPCASLDRGTERDPFYGEAGNSLGIEKDYIAAAKIMAPASIDLETAWNSDKTELTVKAITKFAFVENGKTYKLAYVLTTNGLSHPGMGAWKQGSSYENNPSYKDDPYLAKLTGLTDETFDITTFNHVVVNTSAIYGIDGSITNPQADQTYTHEYKFDVKDNDLIENPENVHVIAALVNEDGVANARVVKAGENTTPDAPTSVLNIEDNNNLPVVYFDLMGRRVDNPQNGIFIRKQGSNATKVLK